MAAADNRTRLIQAIRSWVHMDNLVESFNTQATNARDLRSKHETEAVGLIKQMGLTASTIQVSGASLQLTTKREPGALTWSYLEREVPAWASRNGISPTQATSLIAWLQEHRENKEKEVLKKSLNKAPV
jgi:hypothetical protein